MQLKTTAFIASGLLGAMMMPIQVAYATPLVGAMQDVPRHAMPQVKQRVNPKLPTAKRAQKRASKEADNSSSMKMELANPPLREVTRKPMARDLKLVGGQFTPPVITDPTSGIACCASGYHGIPIRIKTEFDVSGEGLPGHTVKVWANLENNGARSLIKHTRATVGDDGRWRAMGFKVSSDDMDTASGFVEINATQIFPATEVRQPDDEAHAEPVILKYRTPKTPPMGAASSSGG